MSSHGVSCALASFLLLIERGVGEILGPSRLESPVTFKIRDLAVCMACRFRATFSHLDLVKFALGQNHHVHPLLPSSGFAYPSIT